MQAPNLFLFLFLFISAFQLFSFSAFNSSKRFLLALPSTEAGYFRR